MKPIKAGALSALTYFVLLFSVTAVLLWLSASFIFYLILVCFSPILLAEDLKLPRTDTYGG